MWNTTVDVSGYKIQYMKVILSRYLQMLLRCKYVVRLNHKLQELCFTLYPVANHYISSLILHPRTELHEIIS